MDTTHTFHTRVGELTISPISFSAITGIAFGGASVPFDIGYCHLSEGARGQYVRDLLGFLPTWKNQKNIVLSSLVESFRRLPTITPRQIIQKVRCFLLIFAVSLLLFLLREVDQIIILFSLSLRGGWTPLTRSIHVWVS